MVSPAVVIAVDGPAASGKGTLARKLAVHYGLRHLDTGLLYRAVGLKAAESGQDPVQVAEKLGFSDLHAPNLRGDDAAQAGSKVAAIPAVRAALRDVQHRFAAEPPGAVLDGRDIGTVVFPNAILKIFMTADPDIRAKRRYDELTQKGIIVPLAEIAENIRMRDREDENRPVSPLRRADDALVLDNSYMTIAEQMDWFRIKWDTLHEENAS